MFRNATVIASLTLLCACATACSDDVASQNNADWIDAGADLGSTDAGVDTSSPDTSDTTDDTSVVDAGQDVADTQDTGADTADTSGQMTTLGWYKPSFESAMFVPEPSVLEGDWEDGCTLPLWQRAEDAGAEMWWANGISETELLGMYPPTASVGSGRKIGLVEATGTVSALGQHGHLGAYDRSFDVTSSSVDVCGTFERLGHCVVPQGWCTKRDVEAFELVDTYLIREIPGAQPSEPTLFYDLTISSDKSGEWTELRLSLAVPGEDQSADNGQLPVYKIDELREVSLTEHTEAYTVTDTQFGDLTGWVALDTISLQESIFVSIAGEDANGNEVHVWGHFSVDETIAYP